MNLSGLIKFQIAQSIEQSALFNEKVKSDGAEHRLGDLANSYFSELTKENNKVSLVTDFSEGITAKANMNLEWFNAFGKSIQDIIYNFDNFEDSYPKFVKIVCLLLFTEPKYKEITKYEQMQEFVLVQNSIPFIFGNTTIDKKLSVPFQPSSLTLKIIKDVLEAITPSSVQSSYLDFVSNLVYSELDRNFIVKNGNLVCCLPIATQYNLYETNRYSGIASLIDDGYSYQFEYDQKEDTDVLITDAQSTASQLYKDFDVLSQEYFEKAKFKSLNLKANLLFEQEKNLFNLLSIREYQANKQVNRVLADLTISFNQLQDDLVVVDLADFAFLYSYIFFFSRSAEINITIDAEGQYLYMSGTVDTTTSQIVTKEIDGEIFSTTRNVSRKAVGRIPIKNSNFSKLNYFLWLYKYDTNVSIREILQSVTEEDLSSIVIPNDYLNQKHILSEKQKSLIEKTEDILFSTDKKDADFLEVAISKANSFISTYAEYSESLKCLVAKKDNVGMLLGDGTPYLNYVYKVNEVFWKYNKNISTIELIAYFISKGDDYHYRLLSLRILGFDAFLFKEQLILPLLIQGFLCIEEFSLNAYEKTIEKPMKLKYKYEYITGYYYEKADALRIGKDEPIINEIKLDLYDSIFAFFGKEDGEKIIQAQTSWLKENKPKMVSIRGKEKSGDLLLPTLYDEKLLSHIEVLKVVERFFNKIKNGIADSSLVDKSLKSTDVVNLYLKRMKAKEFITEYFSSNIFYELALLDNEVDDSKKYGIISKKDGAIIYHGVGADTQQDCIDYAKSNLLFKDLNSINYDYNKIKKYTTEGVDTYSSSRYDEPMLPKYNKESCSSIEYINLNIAVNNSKLIMAIQAYIPFTKKMLQMLYESHFISEATWLANRDKYTLIDLSDTHKHGEFKTLDDAKEYIEKNIFLLSDSEARDIYNNIIIEFNQIYSKSIKEGDIQFSKHLILNPIDAEEYEYYWNLEYNYEMHPSVTKEIPPIEGEQEVRKEQIYDNSKFPIFLEHSRYFGINHTSEFVLGDSQIDGVKYYVSNKNSALLAHEVGFGKTTTSICCMFHSMITGGANRPFVCVPPTVYRNFYKEIKGEPSFRGLMPNLNVVELFNARSSVFLKIDKKGNRTGLKNYSDNQVEIIEQFQKLKKAKQGIVNEKYNNGIGLGNSENGYENFAKDLEAYFDKNVPLWRTEPIIKQDTFDRFEKYLSNLKTEKQEKVLKEETSFKNKIAVSENLFNYEADNGMYLSGVKKATSNDSYGKFVVAEKKAYDNRTGRYAKLSYQDAEREYIDTIEKKLKERHTSLREKYEKYEKGIDATYEQKMARYVNKVLQLMSYRIYDTLGYYTESFMADNTIVISSHTSLSQFEVPISQATVIADEVNISSSALEKFVIDISTKPVSFSKLNTDMMVVDEVHNFNEYYYKSKKLVVKYDVRNGDFFEAEKKYGKATSNSAKNLGVVSFNTKATATSVTKVTLFDLLKNNYSQNFKKSNLYNNLLLSATPFVDNLYQMISVFSMLKPCMDVFEFYNNFCYEDYVFGQGGDGKITYTANISAFKNKLARNQFIKNYTQFQTFDKRIEEQRPRKYTFPFIETEVFSQDKIASYQESSSTIPLSDVQYDLIKNIGKFLSGAISISEIAEIKNPIEIKKRELADILEDVGVYTEELENAIEADSAKQVLSFLEELSLGKYDKGDSNFDELQTYLESIAQSCERLQIPNPFSKRRKKSNEEDADDDSDDEGSISEIGSMVDATMRLQYGAKVQQRLCLSPYMFDYGEKDEANKRRKGWAENAKLPSLSGNHKDNIAFSAKTFVENSPKILFAIRSCINTIEYHVNRNENVSGQIMFINDQNFTYGGEKYDSFDLISVYLKSVYGLKKEFDVTIYDDDNEKDVTFKISEVECIRGSINPNYKKAIELGFNRGLVKVLLGSSSIKEGINLQGMTDNKNGIKHGTSTMYILTPDYQPMVFMQLEGRGWRQGNPLDNIRIVYILHKNSIDQHIYSRLKTKIMQVKSLLEAGVYEVNTTQFQQDIQGVSEYLITDVEKKVNLKWLEKEKAITFEAKQIGYQLASANELKQTYAPNQYLISAVIPFANDLIKFVNANSIANALSQIITYTNKRAIHPIYQQFYDAFKLAQSEHSEIIREEITDKIKEQFEIVLAEYDARKKEHNEKLKAKVEPLKNARKEKEASLKKLDAENEEKLKSISGKDKPLNELAIKEEIKELNLQIAKIKEEIMAIERAITLETVDAFVEIKPNTKSKEYLDIVEIFEPTKKAYEAQLNKKLASIIDDYGQVISDMADDYNFRKTTNIKKIELLSDTSTSDIISKSINELLRENIDYISLFWENKRPEYAILDDKVVLYNNNEEVHNDALLTYSFLFDCINSDYEVTTFKSNIGFFSLLAMFYNIAYEKNDKFRSIIENGSYSWGSVKKIKFTYYTVATKVKSLLQYLQSGQFPLEVLSAYDSIVLSKSLTMADIDVISDSLKLELDKKELELSNKANFKASVRKAYLDKDAMEAKERAELTTTQQFVELEVSKFSKTNNMIYFRDAELNYLQTRIEIQNKA